MNSGNRLKLWLKDINMEWNLLYAALDHKANLGQDLYGRSENLIHLVNALRETCDISGLSRASEPPGNEGEVT